MATDTASFGPLPGSWGQLSWRQLCDCWLAKMRYGGNGDVARAAALLSLLGLEDVRGRADHPVSGEAVYTICGVDGRLWTVTPRELSQAARSALPWFDWPYGDQGEKEVKDDKGNVVMKRRDAVPGYVGPMRDAMMLPVETLRVGRRRFALPQLICSNLTWQQYRSLQGITPQLFREGTGEEAVTDLQAQFLAHCLMPRSMALLDTSGGSIRLRPHWEYRYNMEQADGMVKWWRKRVSKDQTTVLFHIVFQVYQTSLTYYASAYPLLFEGGGNEDLMRDALQGEVGTINAIMMEAHYTSQQEVYDSFLPFVLDILNTMSKKAKQIEAMNAKIKRRH